MIAPNLDALRWFRGAPPAPGAPRLLFFWGTWCKPCKLVVPAVLAYAKARGLPLIAISRDTPQALAAFTASWTAPFPHTLGFEHPDHPVHTAFDAFSVPRLVEVGAGGLIVAVHYGVTEINALVAP